ncbi:MAG: ATP-binding cassette domain-containing protein [Pseudomonadota bacterium]
MRADRANGPPLVRMMDFTVTVEGHEVLRNVSFDVNPNECLALVGTPGCGKRLVLRCLAGVEEVPPRSTVSGRVELGLQGWPAPQFGWMTPRLARSTASPLEIVTDAARSGMIGTPVEGVAKARAQEALVACDLLDEIAITSSSGMLSELEHQRLSLACAMAENPEILLLDEPCSPLNASERTALARVIRRIGHSRSVVLTTSDLHFAVAAAHRIAFFSAGRLVEIGPSGRVASHPMDPDCAAFVAQAGR